MENRNIIVIGASAGGFEAIKQLINDLPADLDAAIFIVWHMSPDVRGILPHVINKMGRLKASHAIDKEKFINRHVYVAPPDHHLLIEDDRVRVTRGPKENRFRPAIDPLFRSAAFSYASRVIGVILSGALDDGVAGLWAIKQQGGLAVVQDPLDAEVSSMPANAINAVRVNHIVPIKDMGALLTKLVQEQAPAPTSGENIDHERTVMEVRLAMNEKLSKKEIFEYGELTPYTCPECHGVLTALREGDRIRFRCHTGHAFSADSLLAGITGYVEETLWNTLRSVQESILLLNHMGDHFAEANQPKVAAMYFKKAADAARLADVIRQATFNHEQLNTDNIRDQANEQPN
ncbi:chemotaxis protein CheB [Chitinophaga silvisoli]|uniref:protein-glutamate methylesterase n=1 Tax=Chitinophaga silvisoli TaxID=2291814 RepID=A0A3E1P8K0_9BACT|nr:chemotaxis protein CheB [Chitinophaga silvisoli]RFM36503.1 chemotaxis protein CheB [Chitinophaga silvisoli]